MNFCRRVAPVSFRLAFCLVSKSSRPLSSEAKGPKIYTKGGDKGRSALFTGERRSKADSVFAALGSVDELSCHVGVSLEHCKDAGQATWNTELQKQLREIQCILQDVGSSVATPRSSARKAHLARVTFEAAHSHTLEVWIDAMTNELPPLKNFILPSGGKLASSLHLARAVCRRCERSLVPLLEADDLESSTYVFLNRLSDFFFTAARFAALKSGAKEEVYLRPKTH